MFKSGIGTGVCWIGALGFGNKRHKSGGSLKVARPIDLTKPIKHGMVALHNVAENNNYILIFIKLFTVIYDKSLTLEMFYTTWNLNDLKDKTFWNFLHILQDYINELL